MHPGNPNEKRYEAGSVTRKRNTEKSDQTWSGKVYCLKCLEVHLELLHEIGKQSELIRTDCARYEYREWTVATRVKLC